MFTPKKLLKGDRKKNVAFENSIDCEATIRFERTKPTFSFDICSGNNDTGLNDEIQRIIAPIDRFECLFDQDENQPEIFVPTDTHHYDEEDYREHRHRAYPHMHQPLKSMGPRVLMKIKTKMKANNNWTQRLAVTSGGISSSTVKSAIENSMIIDPIIGVYSKPLIINRKKRKRKRKRPKKHEPFRPTLSKLSEESNSPMHAFTMFDNADYNSVGGLVLEELGEAMRPRHDGSSVAPIGTRISFLDEIASSDTPIGFLDITQYCHTARQHSLPLFDYSNYKDSPEKIILCQSAVDLKKKNDQYKYQSTSEGGPLTTAGFDKVLGRMPDPMMAVIPIDTHSNENVTNQNNSAQTIGSSHCDFQIGSADSVDQSHQDISNADMRTKGQRSISHPSSSTVKETSPFHPQYHHHRRHTEHYDKCDLEKRTFSGQDIRSLWQCNELEEIDEYEASLGDEIIDDMRDHRFFDIPAMNRPRIHNKYMESNKKLLHRSMSVSHSRTEENFQRGCQSIKKCIARGDDSCKVNGYTKSQQDLIFQSYTCPGNRISNNKMKEDPYPLFVEMDILKPNKYWREISRWVRYEQRYNELSDTFGRAHSSPLKFTSFTQFRIHLENAIFMPHIVVKTLEEAINQLTEELLLAQLFSEPRDSIYVKEVLKWRHLHAGEKFTTEDQSSQQPFESTKDLTSYPNKNFNLRLIERTPDNFENGAFAHSLSECNTRLSFDHGDSKYGLHSNFPSVIKMLKNSIPILRHSKYPKSDLEGHLPETTEGVSVQVGALETLKKPFLAILRFKNPVFMDRVMELNIPIRFLILCLGPPGKVQYEELGRIISSMLIDKVFCKLMYRATDKCEIIEGLYKYLDTCFVLSYSGSRPTRNMHSMVDHISDFVRAESTPSPRIRIYSEKEVISNDAKRIVRYHSKDREETAQLLCHEDVSVDNGYKDQGEQSRRSDSARYEQELWDVTDVIYEEQEYDMNSSKGLKAQIDDNDCQVEYHGVRKSEDKIIISPIKKQSPIQFQMCFRIFFFLFRLLRLDMIKYKERFASDFIDAFKKENITVVLCALVYLYFVCLSPALTFGVLLGDLVSSDFNVRMVLICNGTLIILFALIGGNPLLVVGITGPLFLMETVIAKMALSFNLPIMLYRFLVASYVSVMGLISLAINITWVMQKVRRSVEECFNGFVGLYYIFKAILTILKIFSITSRKNESSDNNTATANRKTDNPIAVGFASLVLAYCMYQICMVLNSVNRSRFFTRKFRKMLDYFNVAIGILTLSLFNGVIVNMLGIHLPTLKTETLNNTWVKLPEFILLRDSVPFVAHAAAFLLALALVSMIFTETAIAGITVTKADKKIVKSSLFAQDQFMCLCIIPLICGLCGWPFMSGASVRSSSHVMAMTKWDQKVIPGVKHKILGVVEQRVTMVVVGSLVLVTAYFEVILSYVPTSVMLGMFLYMGVRGVRDLVVTRRLVSMFKRRKHWKDHEYLMDIPPNVLKSFEVIQLGMIIIMFSMNWITEFTGISWSSFLIPVILFVYAISRELVLPRIAWFSPYLDKLDPRHYVLMAPICVSYHSNMFSSDKEAALVKISSPFKGRLLESDVVVNSVGVEYDLDDSKHTSADEWSSSSNSYQDS